MSQDTHHFPQYSFRNQINVNANPRKSHLSNKFLPENKKTYAQQDSFNRKRFQTSTLLNKNLQKTFSNVHVPSKRKRNKTSQRTKSSRLSNQNKLTDTVITTTKQVENRNDTSFSVLKEKAKKKILKACQNQQSGNQYQNKQLIVNTIDQCFRNIKKNFVQETLKDDANYVAKLENLLIQKNDQISSLRQNFLEALDFGTKKNEEINNLNTIVSTLQLENFKQQKTIERLKRQVKQLKKQQEVSELADFSGTDQSFSQIYESLDTSRNSIILDPYEQSHKESEYAQSMLIVNQSIPEGLQSKTYQVNKYKNFDKWNKDNF